ncbi:MAG: tRNA lysidine(34) synthetase TilS [Anaerolineales bacterium]
MFSFLESGKLLVVGVSGGPDSLALLHVLRGAGCPLLVCHFNHRLRPESASDAAHVQKIAEEMGLPFVTDSADVAAYAGAEGLSVEEAARELRYRFLFRAAREAGAGAVAVGHTADDQAETVLMHFLRGAGLAGLKGMPPRVILPVFDAEIPLVRPLLSWTRAQTEAYCRQHNLPYLTDSSNADTAYFRNRLRHQLLPQLEAYNPQIRHTLAKSALALQGDYELLNELVNSAWENTVSVAGNGFVAFNLPYLRQMSPALRRNLFRRAAFTLKPGLRDVGFEALERACTLKATELAGGLKTLIEGETLYLTEDEAELPTPYPQISVQCSVFSHQYSVSSIQLENGWELHSSLLTPLRGQAENWSLMTDNWSAHFDADLAKTSPSTNLRTRLTVRPFRAGDRFEPLGMPGQTMKLSDLFVNLKIPKRFRKNWPVLCVEDEIAWIPGLRMAHGYRVTDSTRRVLVLRLTRS